MSISTWRLRRLESVDDGLLDGLARVLMDCVEGGASVSFMHPLTHERAVAFWRHVADGVAKGERALLVAEDADGVCGTVQLVLNQPENQPHRADLAKMLVHRRARRQGLGAALMRAAEETARECGKTLLVLDAVTGGDAERLYQRLGWQTVGMIPEYALMPKGEPCSTTIFYRKLACIVVLLQSVLFAHAAAAPAVAAEGKMSVSSPLEYQVYQRATQTEGHIVVAGTLSKQYEVPNRVEVRLIGLASDKSGAAWRTITNMAEGATNFRAELSAPAGGWYRLEVRLRHLEETVAESAVEHVGVGDVFVIAGQSNSANHGEEKQRLQRGLAAAFHQGRWQLAHDPQPGASGNGGSFIPPFCDAMVERFKVPVGIVAAGVGATSVREWLPRGTRFPNPPTLTNHVRQLATGEWESKGALFYALVSRMKQLGPQGFRAVLWHQGESDANQTDVTRTLRGELYQKYLGQLIGDSRREIGWDVPWFVAKASYHTPADAGSDELRAAQEALWKSGLALEGPDTDALVGEFRDNGGRGVHFSGKGLRQHGGLWAAKVAAWLEKQCWPPPLN